MVFGNRVQVAGLEARRLGGDCMRVAGAESHGWGAVFLPMSEVSVLGLGMTVLRGLGTRGGMLWADQEHWSGEGLGSQSLPILSSA